MQETLNPRVSINWETPPAPLKPSPSPPTLPEFEILQQISSRDQNGYQRLQIQAQAKQPINPEKHKYIFAQIVADFQAQYDIIWMTIISDSNVPDFWTARADWFSPQIPPYHQYSVSKKNELFKGIHIEYKN